MTAIIVLNYNDWITTKTFLNEIGDYNNLDKIIIVDNYSSDNSWENLEKLKSEKIDVIKTDANRGYAAGNNFGIQYVRNNYQSIDKIIISNPDIIVSESDITKILQLLDKGYDLATGLIHNYDQNTKKSFVASNFCWNVPTYGDLLGNHFLPIYKFRRCILKNSIYPNLSDFKSVEIIDTECVPGCFFAITMSALNEMGDFDEGTFLFTEETILGWNLKNKNKKVCVLKKSKILHAQSISINKSISNEKKKAKFRLDGEILYLKKYLGSSPLKISIYKKFFWIAFYQRSFWIKMRRKK